MIFFNSYCYGQKTGARGKKNANATNQMNEKGRNLILTGKINEAIASYAPLAQNSTNTTLIAEYAYALALAGIYDAALINLDRTGSNFNETDIKYFTSQVFVLMGYNDIATEFWKPSYNSIIPSWIALKANELSEKYKSTITGSKKTNREELIVKFKQANELVEEHSYLQSIALFHEITDILPNEFLPYAGYSISLEKIGALEKSQQVIEKALTLVGNNQENSEKRQFLQYRLAAVKAKISSYAKVKSEYQKNIINDRGPQMMAYGGTMITSSLFSLNCRIGYFISDKTNTSFNLGVNNSSTGGSSLNLGLSVYSRYHALICGLGFQNYESNWSIVYSLGVSIRFKKHKNQSFDIFLDLDKGFGSNSVTTENISFGIPIYFGKRK